MMVQVTDKIIRTPAYIITVCECWLQCFNFKQLVGYYLLLALSVLRHLFVCERGNENG